MLLFSFFKTILLLFNYSCLHFPPRTAPNPSKPTSLPSFPDLLILSMRPLYLFLKTVPLNIPSHLHSGKTVVDSNAFGYVLLTFFFC